MLQDIGSLQTEETYTGKNIVGTKVETVTVEGPLSTVAAFAFFFCLFILIVTAIGDGPNTFRNAGITWGTMWCPMAWFVIAIISMAYGTVEQDIEVTKYGNKKVKKIKYYFADGKYNRWDFDKEYEQYLTILGMQENNPILVGTRSDSNIKYWLYQDKIWKENEEYRTNEVKLLVDEKLEKKKLRLERAQKAKERRENPEIKEDDERSRRISQGVKDKVWNRDNGKCVECGSNEDLEFDHIIPFSKGGANTYRNIQLLCEHCNRSKSDKIGNSDYVKKEILDRENTIQPARKHRTKEHTLEELEEIIENLPITDDFMSKLHKHGFVFKKNLKNHWCDICKKKSESLEAYRCELCDLDVCPDCFNETDESKIPDFIKLSSKDNWIGPDYFETGPDVSDDWYLNYEGNQPEVDGIYGENYGVDRGDGAIPIEFYVKKWGFPEGYGNSDFEKSIK